MKPSQLRSFLCTSLKAKRKVLITGSPGVGKSDIVTAAAADAGFDLKLFHPAVSEPTDFAGLPGLVDGKAEFLPYGKLRELIEATKPTVAFLDDIGQAPHGVQAALMQLILARRVNGHRVSDGVVFLGATNRASDRAGVHSILEPVKSRWDTIVQLDADVDSWCDWALGEGDMPAEIVGFIRFRPELLNKFEPSRELTNSPCPRTVAAVGRWLADGVDDHEIIAGAAGEAFAAELRGFLKVFRSLPEIDVILKNPAKAPVPSEPSALYAVCAALTRRFVKDNAAECFTYAARMPKEFEVVLVRDAMRACKELASSKHFTAWAVKNAAALT